MSRPPMSSTTLALMGQGHSGPERRNGAPLGAVLSLLGGELSSLFPTGEEGRRVSQRDAHTRASGLEAAPCRTGSCLVESFSYRHHNCVS